MVGARHTFPRFSNIQGRHEKESEESAHEEKLVVLVALALVAVMVFEALDVSDADAKKKKRRPPAPPAPPNYTFVLCKADTTCSGSTGADLMVGSAGDEALKSAAGNDIYIGSASQFDSYIDESTSSDLYGAFKDEEFGLDIIVDMGGIDLVDLSTESSSYASTDFEFLKKNLNGDGDDLHIDEINFDGDDDIYVYDYFGSGQIEYIKFSDKTLTPADISSLTTP